MRQPQNGISNTYVCTKRQILNESPVLTQNKKSAAKAEAKNFKTIKPTLQRNRAPKHVTLLTKLFALLLTHMQNLSLS